MAGPATILLIGLAGALGFYAVARRKKAAPTTSSGGGTNGGTNGGGTGGGGGGGTNGGGGGGTGNYVGGSPTYVWPHKDIWPTASSLLGWLGARGYNVNVGDTPLSFNNTAAVGSFQNDFNTVRESIPGMPAKLSVDAKMGNKTIEAMWYVAKTFLGAPGVTWKAIVAEALKD